MPSPERNEGSGGRDRGSMASALRTLAERYGLGPGQLAGLEALADLLIRDPVAPTSIRTEQAVIDDHLADSLVALECGAVRRARVVLDLGTGAGLPGLPLAIARPDTRFTLLESSSRKCRFLERAVEVCGLSNVDVLHERAEAFRSGREGYDLVTARAVATLPVTAEYAAPLLRRGGALAVWRGRRDPRTETELSVAAAQLGLGEPSIHAVRPYPRAEHRHLYLMSKLRETPDRFPRRPGMALKRPLGAQVAREQEAV